MDPSREAYWSRKLGGLRPGAEPLDDQLRRRFQAMVLITGLTVVIAMIMLAIFAGFGRPDIGLRIAGLIVLPASSWFWIDYLILRFRVSAYVREQGDDAPPG